MSEDQFSYWTLIEPAFQAVSIYDGPETFLAQFNPYPEHIQNLLAAHWCESEICNGGFNQLFFNGTGVLFPEAIKGFRALQLSTLAKQCDAAMARWCPKPAMQYPRKREDRFSRVKLPPFVKQPLLFRLMNKVFPPLDFRDLDQPFYDALDSTDNFEDAANAYARRFV